MTTPTNATASRADLYQEVTDRIIAALERGVAPWVCPWDRAGGRPHNGASGYVYRGINVVLLAMCGHADARWYTFTQARALGGHVREGDHGTRVVFWRFVQPQQAAEPVDDDAVAGGGPADRAPGPRRPRPVPLLRHYIVFNHEQIEWPARRGEPERPTVDVRIGFDRAAALVGASGADIRQGGVRAYL